MKRLASHLYFWVLLAILAGGLFGYLDPARAVMLRPLGDGFIALVKMLISPIIFCTVVLGIAGMEDMKKVGKTGGFALLYFEIMSTVALIVGLVIINVVQPGVGMNVDPTTLDTKAVAAYAEPGKLGSTTDFILNIIPTTVVDAFAKGDILEVLFFAVLFGFALHALGGKESLIFRVVEQTSGVLFRIVGLIMRVAPLGAFGAMAFTIGTYGFGTLANLAKLMVTFYMTCIVFIFVVLGIVAWLHGFNILKYLRYIKEELLIVLGTSSSEAALPPLMNRLESLGAGKSTVGLVVPTGYSFNLDGTAIYLTMAAVFVAQATNTNLDIRHQVVLLAVLLLTSKGAAGVTGSGFIVLAATLSAVGTVPVTGLALILGIDRFMSEARALTNIIGNGVATLVVARWTGDLDVQQMQERLAGSDNPDVSLNKIPAVAQD